MVVACFDGDEIDLQLDELFPRASCLSGEDCMCKQTYTMGSIRLSI